MDSAKLKQQPEITNLEPVMLLKSSKLSCSVTSNNDVRMLLDRKGHHYALSCAVCEPEMVDAMENRH